MREHRGRATRAERRDKGAEGRLTPVVLALAFLAVFGSVLGWLMIGRNLGDRPDFALPLQGPLLDSRPPLSRSNQRDQLLLRLRVLQVNRSWFFVLVNNSFLKRHPEYLGRLSHALEDKQLQGDWADLAQDWLARIERFPPSLRAKFGLLADIDWYTSSRRLMDQGIPSSVLQYLVGAYKRSATWTFNWLNTRGTVPPALDRRSEAHFA